MKKIVPPIAMIWLAGLLIFSCQTIQTIPDNFADTNQWAGIWEEDWPGSSQMRDQYRIELLNDGNTLSLEPITRPERQNITDLHWNGQTLTFVNVFDERTIGYSLSLDATGTILEGTVTLPSGNAKQIKWYKIDAGQEVLPDTNIWPPLPQLTSVFAAPATDWTGRWTEEWPDRNENDIYFVRVQESDTQAMIVAATNQERQHILDTTWNNQRLTFLLQYDSVVYFYELVPINPATLKGLVTSQNGKTWNIIWRKTDN